ncbi:MAG: hypothetical protein KDI88_05085 [Gammaproteobacteria bacterium]|nr:hypothetical protein [Gammaproteobacteria bacterium]
MLDETALLETQRQDHEELLAFLDELRATVQQAMALRPNEGSEVVLALKENLDRLYEQSAGLADDHGGNQSAIADLVEVIMRNVERGAAGDAHAVAELAQEREARAVHFQLLRFPLVADLLHPHSLIDADDLAPSLLSASAEELAAALQLFDLAQLDQLRADAQDCLARCEQAPADALQRLQQVVDYVALLRRRSPLD